MNALRPSLLDIILASPWHRALKPATRPDRSDGLSQNRTFASDWENSVRQNNGVVTKSPFSQLSKAYYTDSQTISCYYLHSLAFSLSFIACWYPQRDTASMVNQNTGFYLMWTTSDQHYSVYSNEQMLPLGLWCAKVWSLSTRGSGMNDFDYLTLMILNVSAKSQYQPRQTALSRFCRLSKLGPTLTWRIGPTERMRLFLLNLFYLKLFCPLIKLAW